MLARYCALYLSIFMLKIHYGKCGNAVPFILLDYFFSAPTIPAAPPSAENTASSHAPIAGTVLAEATIASASYLLQKLKVKAMVIIALTISNTETRTAINLKNLRLRNLEMTKVMVATAVSECLHCGKAVDALIGKLDST